MGSIISKIDDDEDDYYYLCKKHNEKPREVYSIHHRWLEDKVNNKTKLSLEEYTKNIEENNLILEIKNKKLELKKLEEKLKKIVIHAS
jgi:hypothetical protein